MDPQAFLVVIECTCNFVGFIVLLLKCYLCSVKIQISLDIQPVWSESCCSHEESFWVFVESLTFINWKIIVFDKHVHFFLVWSRFILYWVSDWYKLKVYSLWSACTVFSDALSVHLQVYWLLKNITCYSLWSACTCVSSAFSSIITVKVEETSMFYHAAAYVTVKVLKLLHKNIAVITVKI